MEQAQNKTLKRWEDLDITDDFIFTRVMRNKKLCRTLLEMILKVKVGEIHFLTSNHGDLAHRARYYQAAADINTTYNVLQYKDLSQKYVIFICTFDPFGQGKPVYSFQNICLDHDEPVFLHDSTKKLFLNTAAKVLDDLDGDLCLFYDYVREKTVQAGFTREVDRTISRMKEERNMYLTYASRMMECR